MIDHRRDDLNEHRCECGSAYVCPVCTPRRSLYAALADVGEHRNLNLRQTVELVRPDNVVVFQPRRRVTEVA